MFIYINNRLGDRLGGNVLYYISLISLAHKNNFFIRINKNECNFKDSIFLIVLFNYIEKYNEKLIDDNIEYEINRDDWSIGFSNVTLNIKSDLISYFINNIYNDIILDFNTLAINNNYIKNIPFDINKTILVHLRLDDRAYWSDYDGSIISNYYINKINNNETAPHISENNTQCPLSKEKLLNIIKIAKNKYIDYDVILLTSPSSDTSELDFPVIRSKDFSFDLFLLSKCNVSILSKSTYAIISLFFNNEKKETYLPIWGHTAVIGINTKYDNLKNVTYFY